MLPPLVANLPVRTGIDKSFSVNIQSTRCSRRFGLFVTATSCSVNSVHVGKLFLQPVFQNRFDDFTRPACFLFQIRTDGVRLNNGLFDLPRVGFRHRGLRRRGQLLSFGHRPSRPVPYISSQYKAILYFEITCLPFKTTSRKGGTLLRGASNDACFHKNVPNPI